MQLKTQVLLATALASITQAVYIDGEEMDYNDYFQDPDDFTLEQIEADLVANEDAFENNPFAMNLAQVGDSQACWKHAHARGIGRRGTYCPPEEGRELHGGLCYKKCDEGFHGVVSRCTKDCPEGYRDTGAYCHKKRGTKGCPEGMRNIGVACQKGGGYDRGAGKEPECGPDMYRHQGLCYSTCPNDWFPSGPVCWQRCPAGTKNCGALCVDESDNCLAKILRITKKVVESIPTSVPASPADVIDITDDVIELYNDEFRYPRCASEEKTWEWNPPKDANGDGEISFVEDRDYWKNSK